MTWLALVLSTLGGDDGRVGIARAGALMAAAEDPTARIATSML